ncbi:MAG: LLM class flavin-dependent oxidoreductase [Nitrososphaerales archaeon]
MVMVKFCVESFGNKVEEVAKFCKLCEDLGYDAFYYGDGPWNYLLDCFSTLSYLSSLTSRIRLGPALSNLFKGYREPIALAKASSTLDNLSKGRFDLRVGCGANYPKIKEWWLAYGYDYPNSRERVEMLEEGLKIIKNLFLKDRFSFKGKYFSVLNANLGPKCYQRHIPIIVACMGKKMLKIASKYADMAEISFLRVHEIRKKIELLNSRLPISLEIDVFIHRDREEALKEAKDYFLRNYLPQDYFDRNLVGNPEDCLTKLLRYMDAGISQFTLVFNQRNLDEAVKLFSEKVVSVVKK